MKININLPPDITEEEIKTMIAIKLFEMEKISWGKAAENAGFSKVEFMDVLAEHGIPVFDYSLEEETKIWKEAGEAK